MENKTSNTDNNSKSIEYLFTNLTNSNNGIVDLIMDLKKSSDNNILKIDK
jgi:hypothetical protein